MAQPSVRVIILLRDQPQREVVERVQAAAAARIDDAEAEYQRLARQPFAFEPIVSAASARRDSVVIETRREIFRQVDLLVGPAQRSVADRLTRLGARQFHSYQVVNAISAEIPVSAVAELEAASEVAAVIPDERHEALLNVSVPALGAPALWAGGNTGSGGSVGVLDSGVFSGNPAFNGITVIDQAFGDAAATGSCFNDASQSSQDMVGHGTHVAGTIAGRGSPDFASYLGVARGLTTLYNLKIGWSQTKNSSGCKGGATAFNSDVLAAFDWALKNTPLRLFNYSYGGTATADDDNGARLFDLIADNYGLTLVISAGNSGPGASTVGTPGTGYNAITVAAVNDGGTTSRVDDTIASFSSRGPTLGSRSKPDIAAPGQVIFAAAYNSNGLIGMQGTSMAAPHITGAAALLAQAGITDPLAVKAVLINTSDGNGWTPDFGWGYANLNTAAQRRDYVKDTIAAAAYRLYRGGTGGFFKATMTWNRHIGTSGNGTTSNFNPLHLYLYSRGNNTLLSQSESALDNVKQVGTTLNGEVVVKVKAGANNFNAVDAEAYALAFSAAGFARSAGPALSGACTAPASVVPGASFTVNCDVVNSGELDAFAVAGNLQAPAGFGGNLSQNFDTVAAGARVTRTFPITAPAAAGSYSLTLNAAGTAYGESVGASARFNVSVGGNAPSSLAINPAALSFSYTAGGAAPAAQSVNVNSTSGSMPFTVTSSDSWLSVRASGESTPATIAVSIVTAGLTARTYNGTITVQSNGAANSPQRVAVTLTVGGTLKVTVANSLTTGSVTGSGCTVPSPVTSFNSSDAQAMVWYLVNGASAGDQPSVDWYAPDQSLYQTGSWSAVTSAGNWCFWAGIDIAGKAPANKPGRWTVKVNWNGSPLVSLSFTIVKPVNVLNSMTTAALPQGNGCPVPSAQNAFFNSDAAVYAWFLVDNTNRGDVPSIAWYQPDGKRYRSASWNPLTDGGAWCFNDSIGVAGKDAAALPGTWTAKVSWNGTLIFTLTFTINPPIVVESSLTSKLKPSGSGCTAPPPSSSFVPSDTISLVWFSVNKANAGDIPSIEWYAPDGSFYDSTEWDPIPSGGNWCFWAWNDVAGTDMAALFGTWTALVYWNDAPVLTQTFNMVPVNVIHSMTTKAIPNGNGCPTPTPASTFVPTDKSAYIWFYVSGAQRGDVPAAKFLTPAGSTYLSLAWDPVPDTMNRCFWAWIDVAGTAAASQLGAWTIQTTWNGIPLETAQFNLARSDPGTPTSLSTMQREGAELPPASNGSGQGVDADSPGIAIPRPAPTGRRSGSTGQAYAATEPRP